jgi:hypothetical protein
MADYAKLVEETESIEFRGISSCALDELLLVKRAISFFETLKRISVCLRTGVNPFQVSESLTPDLVFAIVACYSMTLLLFYHHRSYHWFIRNDGHPEFIFIPAQ